MITQLSVRVTGVILVVLGSSLAVVMASLILWAREMVGNSGTPGVSARFNGTPGEAIMMFALFGIIMFLGIAFTIGGLWQIVFARRNKVIIWVALLGGLAVIFAGSAFMAVSK